MQGEALPPQVVNEFFTLAQEFTDDDGNLKYRDFLAQMDADATKAWAKKGKKLGVFEVEKKKKKGGKKKK